MSEILSIISERDKKRFWSKVEVCGEDSCWEWKDGKTVYGYGSFSIGGRKIQIKRFAHRVALTLDKGLEIPSSMSVLHSCDNRTCCNPKHLHVGTHQENMDEMKIRKRSAISFGFAKLTWSGVDEIRSDSRPVNVLAEVYGVCESTISDVLKYKTWQEKNRHVAKGLS